jgi:hypothetical protein
MPIATISASVDFLIDLARNHRHGALKRKAGFFEKAGSFLKSERKYAQSMFWAGVSERRSLR